MAFQRRYSRFRPRRYQRYRRYGRGRARIRGHGSYHAGGQRAFPINKNSLMMGNDPPSIKNKKGIEGGVTICHKEYLTDINSASGNGSAGSSFQIQNFLVNPGLINTFPWLSQVAANFQEYEVNGLAFEYKSLSADAVVGSNNSGALGDVIMATNYNSASANYANKQQMLESQFSSDGKPSKSSLHFIECARSQTPVSELYIRTASVPSGQDQRLYDLCNFQIATQGCQANSALLGELWVTYEITLYKPILGGTDSGENVLTDKFQLSAVVAGNPLGTSQTLIPGSMGGTINGSTGTVYSFPSFVTEGNWLIVYTVKGTAASLVNPTFSFSPGLSVNQWFIKDTVILVKSPPDTVSSGQLTVIFIVQFGPGPNTNPATITWSTGGTYPTTIVGADLIVTQISSNIQS